jgi:hypothetical protein
MWALSMTFLRKSGQVITVELNGFSKIVHSYVTNNQIKKHYKPPEAPSLCHLPERALKE